MPKKPAKSKGTGDMSKSNGKTKSVAPAARMRATELKNRIGPEKPHTVRKFELEQVVAVPESKYGYDQAKIVGYEWGDNLRAVNRPVWMYYIRKSDLLTGEHQFILEDELTLWHEKLSLLTKVGNT